MRNVSYDYHLHPDQVALSPASPRDSSRLLIYDTENNSIQFDRFFRLAGYLPKASHLVVNETVVAPSRVTLFKSTGGKVVCLVLLNEPTHDGTIRFIGDRKLVEGAILTSSAGEGSISLLKVLKHIENGVFLAQLLCQRHELLTILEKNGVMPIPMYLRNTPLNPENLKRTYQTTFALTDKNIFSVAAPTASLHFTKRVFKSVMQKDVGIIPLRLEVGLGTFAPLTKLQLETGKLHQEWYRIPLNSQKQLFTAKKRGEKLIAVGTTVVRTLESASETLKRDERSADYNPTELFIRPGYRFTTVNGLITNFHLPNSSLMMLVEALLQYKNAKRTVTELYKIALSEGFRFYSFGDAMLIL